MSVNGIPEGTLFYHKNLTGHGTSITPQKLPSETRSTIFREGMTLDDVKISDEARALWDQNLKDRAAYTERTGGDIYRHIDFTQDDLKQVKEKFKSLQESKADLDSGIDKVLKNSGIKLASGDKMKIELDADGKVIVGGVADGKTAKAIEKALTNDKELVNKLKNHREQESKLSAELKDVTGMSLKDFRNRLSTVQNDLLNEKPFKTTSGETYSKDEMMAFRDQSLSWVDPDFMKEVGEYIKSDNKYDFSAGHDILADPAATMNKTVQDIRDRLAKAFKFENESLGQFYDASNPEDKEYLDKMRMSLDGVKISIDADGNVEIEGDIAKDGRMNEKGKTLITDLVRGLLKDNSVTGEKHEYKLAAERMMNLYEDQFGELNGDEKALTTITNGMVSSQVFSPKKEAEINTAIQKDVNEAVKQMGGTLQEQLEIDIDKDGKISAANLPPADKNRQIVLDILKELNSRLDSTTVDKNIRADDNSLPGILKRLKQNINHLDVLSEGGAAKIQKSYSY